MSRRSSTTSTDANQNDTVQDGTTGTQSVAGTQGDNTGGEGTGTTDDAKAREAALQDRETALTAREAELQQREASTTDTAKALDARRQEMDDEQRRFEEARHQAEQDAQAQREDLARGGEGVVEGGETVQHSITDPKATPVDYSVETLRRPGQRIVPPDVLPEATPSAPVVSLPYGSEPRNFDTSTGLVIAPPAEKREDVDGDDTDADVDQGQSAAQRAEA